MGRTILSLSSGEILLILAAFILAACIYFLPTIIAEARRHRDVTAIVVLNLLAGWTLLGWAFALAWSLTSNVRESWRELLLDEKETLEENLSLRAENAQLRAELERLRRQPQKNSATGGGGTGTSRAEVDDTSTPSIPLEHLFDDLPPSESGHGNPNPENH